MANPAASHPHARRFYRAFALLGLVLVLAFATWFAATLILMQREKTKNLALVRALEGFRIKEGRYPKRLEELGATVGGYAITDFSHYDQSADCPSLPSYCGSGDDYEVVYAQPAMVICRYRLGKDDDFVCAD